MSRRFWLSLVLISSLGGVVYIFFDDIWVPSRFLFEEPAHLADGERQKLLATLKSDQSTGPEKTYALSELARAGDEEAFAFSLKAASSEDPGMREAAAQSLGYDTSRDAWGKLRSLSEDREPLVRTRAIVSLCHARGRGVVERLEHIAGDKKRPPSEVIAALGCLYRLSEKEYDRVAWLRKLSALVQAKGEAGDSRLALSTMTGVANKREETQEVARKIALESQDAVLVANSISYLASLAPGAGTPATHTLTEHYGELFARPEVPIRLAAINSLHFFCPPTRWQLLNDLAAKETDQMILAAAATEAAYLDAPGAHRYLDSLKSRIQGASAFRDFKEAHARIAQANHLDACAGR
jgi:hypothetical protein